MSEDCTDPEVGMTKRGRRGRAHQRLDDVGGASEGGGCTQPDASTRDDVPRDDEVVQCQEGGDVDAGAVVTGSGVPPAPDCLDHALARAETYADVDSIAELAATAKRWA